MNEHSLYLNKDHENSPEVNNSAVSNFLDSLRNRPRDPVWKKLQDE